MNMADHNTIYSLVCVMVLRSHVLTRLSVLNDLSASTELAGETSSKRKRASTSRNRSLTAGFHSLEYLSVFLNRRCFILTAEEGEVELQCIRQLRVFEY